MSYDWRNVSEEKEKEQGERGRKSIKQRRIIRRGKKKRKRKVYEEGKSLRGESREGRK